LEKKKFFRDYITNALRAARSNINYRA
jgi:hypothetical protein